MAAMERADWVVSHDPFRLQRFSQDWRILICDLFALANWCAFDKTERQPATRMKPRSQATRTRRPNREKRLGGLRKQAFWCLWRRWYPQANRLQPRVVRGFQARGRARRFSEPFCMVVQCGPGFKLALTTGGKRFGCLSPDCGDCLFRIVKY